MSIQKTLIQRIQDEPLSIALVAEITNTLISQEAELNTLARRNTLLVIELEKIYNVVKEKAIYDSQG
jgi:hypothetical protein